VALYFAFLSTYTNSLTFISVIGTLFYFFETEAYSPYYSILLLLWSTFFVEYWSVCERKLAVRWSTKGVFEVEQRKYHNVKKAKQDGSWWKSDTKKLLRVVASFSMLFVCMLILAVLLTVIFILEAFIPILYTGPGSQLVVRSMVFV
jgi:anoctamin-10